MAALRKRNLGMFPQITCFYCRGAWNEEIMSWTDRTLCNMLKKLVKKKDPSSYEPWEAALMEAIGSNHDWTDKANIQQIVEYVREG